MPHARFAIAAPVRAHPPLTLDEARGLGAFAEELSEQLTFGRSELRRLFPCCGSRCSSSGLSSTTELLGAHAGCGPRGRSADRRGAGTDPGALPGGPHHLVRRGRRRGHLLVLIATRRCGRARRPRMGARPRRDQGRARVGLAALGGALAGFVVATGVIAWLGPPGVIEPSARDVGDRRFDRGHGRRASLVVGVVSGLQLRVATRTTSRPRADRCSSFRGRSWRSAARW